MEKEIDEAIMAIDKYVEEMYRDYQYAIKKINEIIAIVRNCVLSFLNNINYYNAKGENIQEEVIVEQLKRLLCGIEKNDPIMVADTLKYEIKESFRIYRELVKTYGK